jgi:chaperonin GroEL (HSP60 family)
MLRDIAILTGGKTITEEINIPLRTILLPDLGQAKKVTVDKNNTVVKGGAKYDQPYLPAHRADSYAHTSPVESTRTHIPPGTHGTLSACASAGPTDRL